MKGISPSEKEEEIQTKLLIGKTGGKYEQEADQVAEIVMRMPEPEVHRKPEAEEEELIQSKPMIDKITPLVLGQVEGVTSKVKPVDNDIPHVIDRTQSQIDGMYGSGQPLAGPERTFFEKRFGYNFSGIRIQTNSQAEMLNRSLNSRAFTTGRDIFFGQGQYNPDSLSGRKLLAHELTHTIQQGASGKMIQADFAVPPTTPNRNVPTLSTVKILDAIAYNQERHKDATEIGLMRDILGISATPAVIDADFINAVMKYQAQYGLHCDGKLGHDVADRLAREIIEEANYLGPANLGSLAPEFNLRTSIQALITANNRRYADYKSAIQAATMIQQHVTLRDQQLLTDLKGKLSWNNWARSIELLGRRAPSGYRMRINGTVRAALIAAWTASHPMITKWSTHNPHAIATDPCQPPPPPPPYPAHEEGGFIYMNLITGDLTTGSVAAGGQAGLVLSAPPNVDDSIVVGAFHTHPNVGVCWGAPFFSDDDNAWIAHNGVPLLMRGAFPAVANADNYDAGNARVHLAGNRGLPGAAGGLAPQATRDGSFDDL